VQVRDANRDELESVLTAAHAVWGRGRALEDFVAFHLALADSPWGREHSRYLVRADDTDRPLSALRIDSLAGRLDDRPVRIAELGALFTIPEARGRGHASALLGRALEEARQAGHDLAMLVASMPQSLYERAGFDPLPASETACRTVMPAPWPKEPAWLRSGDDPLARIPGLRRGGEDDLPAIAAIHAEETAQQRLRIDRDPAAWEFVLMKTGMPRGRGTDEDRFWVIERGGRVKAYVFLQAESPTLRWREHGALRDARVLLAELFWCALSVARRRRLERIEGWQMPEILTLGPLYPASQRSRKTDRPMLRSLDPALVAPVFANEEECRLWELDAL